MTQDDFNKAMNAGDVSPHAAPGPVQPPHAQPTGYTLDDFLPVLASILTPKLHLTVAPDFTPRTFVEQIQLFDNGAARRLYIFVNGTWRYCTLT